MAMTIVESRAVTAGVRTRLGVHGVGALDDSENVLGVKEFASTPASEQALLDWLAGFGPVSLVGVEHTCSGTGLVRHLHHAGVSVIELDTRSVCGQGGQDDRDTLDLARAAARGEGRRLPAGRETTLEAIEPLITARRSAESAREAAVELIRSVAAAAPVEVSLVLSPLRTSSLLAGAVALRPAGGHPVGYATRVVLRELGERACYLAEQVSRLDEVLIPLVTAYGAGLLASFVEAEDGRVELLVAAHDTARA